MTGEEFKNTRKQLGLSQNALSQAIGINLKQIARIESGSSPVRDYHEKLILSLSEKNNESNNIQIPIYDAIASAGEGLINDENIKEYVSISKFTLKTFFNLPNTQNLSIITAKGNSMTPTIPENSYILVQQKEVSDGQICVCRIGEELYVKRLQKLPKYRLISDNKDYEAIDLDNIEYQIIGVVVGIFKNII